MKTALQTVLIWGRWGLELLPIKGKVYGGSTNALFNHPTNFFFWGRNCNRNLLWRQWRHADANPLSEDRDCRTSVFFFFSCFGVTRPLAFVLLLFSFLSVYESLKKERGSRSTISYKLYFASTT